MTPIKLLIALAVLQPGLLAQSISQENDFTTYANPFVGAAEFGHCFPGACVPFGNVQASPETGNCTWEYCSGYQYKDQRLSGFAQTRLNGTGCPDLGDLLIMPFSGDARRTDYSSAIDKAHELASPGYYAVQLADFGIKAEATASAHSAVYRLTYNGPGAPQLLIDFQSNTVGSQATFINHVLDSHVGFEGDRTITGFARTKIWVDRTYYYVIEFSRPYAAKTELPTRAKGEKAPRHVFGFDLKPGEQLLVKIALSSSSVEAAKKNLQAEVPAWDFDLVRSDAGKLWNDMLSRVRIAGTRAQKNIFYTALYHLFIQPNNIADAGEKPQYSTLSLWDTYRAAHPLYTIIAPEKVDGFVNSFLDQYDRQGFLPIWALWGQETFCMIANHSVPVIVDAYLKGFKGFDADKAYQAIKTSLTQNHRNSDWTTYDKYGYYPFDLVKEESVSRTLESSYDDYCAAQMAKSLGKTADYQFFLKRSGNYKNLFDSQTKLMRGKDSKGEWRAPFDPLALSHASTSGGDYTEGNAWQYTWQVQHDPQGLLELMGGDEVFTAKLDTLFTMDSTKVSSGFVKDVTGLIGQYAHGNEPCHHVAYLYALAGKPAKTQELIRKICNTQYLDKVEGLCGNDDCGQMSAWYVLSALGFYPVNPCGGEYVLGAPQVAKAEISLPGGKTFTIEAVHLSDKNQYVKSMELNGQAYTQKTISHQAIMQGGTLKFHMSNDWK